MTTLFLQHKSERGDSFRTERVRHTITEAPVNRSRTGYGSKIPTQYMIEYFGRKYRVYSVCHSNVTREYVIVRGEQIGVLIFND